MLQYRGRVITGIANDSRKVLPGNVFVAIEGVNYDGHNYIQQAIANGAVLVICEHDLKHGIPYIKVKNSRAALALLARNFYHRPDKNLVTIGVTGTNGKTTIATIINHILNFNNVNTGLIGTNGITFNGYSWDSLLTTPDAIDLYGYLHQMVREQVKVVAMELSSHSLKQERVEGMLFNMAVFSNLSLDHLDLHGTFQDYLETKLLVFKKLKPGGIIIYNKDDIISKEIEKISDFPKISFSTGDKNADLSGYIVKTGASGTQLEIKVNANYFPFRGTFDLKTCLLGEHNVSNILAAIACALSLGLTPGEIVHSFASFPGVKRRLEVIYNRDFTIIDDFCHNPANYKAVLEAMHLYPRNNIHLVTLIRGNRGELVNKENGKVIAQWSRKLGLKKIIVSNCQDTAHHKDQVTQEEERAFLRPLWQAGLKVEHVATLNQAIEQVLKDVKREDLILLLGSHPFKKVAELILSKISKANIYHLTSPLK